MKWALDIDTTKASAAFFDSYYSDQATVQHLMAEKRLFCTSISRAYHPKLFKLVTSNLIDEGNTATASKDVETVTVASLPTDDDDIPDDDINALVDDDDDSGDDAEMVPDASEKVAKKKKKTTKKTAAVTTMTTTASKKTKTAKIVTRIKDVTMSKKPVQSSLTLREDDNTRTPRKMVVSGHWFLMSKQRTWGVRVVVSNCFVKAKTTTPSLDTAIVNTTYGSMYSHGPDAQNRFLTMLSETGKRSRSAEMVFGDTLFKIVVLDVWALAQNRSEKYRVTTDDGSGVNPSTASQTASSATGGTTEERYNDKMTTKFHAYALELVEGVLVEALQASDKKIVPSVRRTGCGCEDCLANAAKHNVTAIVAAAEEAKKAYEEAVTRAAEKAQMEAEVAARRLAKAAQAKLNKEIREVAAQRAQAKRDAKAQEYEPCTLCGTSTLKSRLLGCDKKGCKNWLCTQCHGLHGAAIKKAKNSKWYCTKCEKKSK